MRLRRQKSNPPPPRQRLPLEAKPQPTVFSYHAKRNQRQIESGRKQPGDSVVEQRSNAVGRNSRGRALIYAVSGILLLYMLFLTPSVRVVQLANDTQGYGRPAKTYERAANDILKASLLSYTKVTIDTTRLDKEMLKKFPELDVASTTVPFFGQRPELFIKSAQPALYLASSNGTFLLDAHGKAMILKNNLRNPAAMSLPTVTDDSNLQITLNKQVLSGDTITFIQAVLRQLDTQKVKYTALKLPASASELDVYISGQPYFVKFNLQSKTVREQTGTFLATRQELSRQHITPTKYIDVRVQGRAYYQ